MALAAQMPLPDTISEFNMESNEDVKNVGIPENICLKIKLKIFRNILK